MSLQQLPCCHVRHCSVSTIIATWDISPQREMIFDRGKKNSNALLSSLWFCWIHTSSRNEMHPFLKYALMLTTWTATICLRPSAKTRVMKLCAIVTVSQDLPRTVNGQWHPPDPTGVLHFLGLVVMLLLNWTAIPNVCCPPCNISNEKWNCWLFTIISSFEWVLPAKYRLGFYTQWCVRAGFLRVKYDVGTALLTTYLFSSSTAFC